jgi:nickel-dependent lactate racemase
MNIKLGYGKTFFDFDYDESRFVVLDKHASEHAPLSDHEVNKAIDAPIASPTIDEIIKANESVLIVVTDATRATASGQVVNLLVRRLIEIGVMPYDIRIIFATGIHRTVTEEEKLELLTPFIVRRIKTINHNARDLMQFVNLGTTKRGVPIELNRTLKEHDHVIITGAVGFHYFAGFSGGRKAICPGLASSKTVTATHKLALDFETMTRREGVGTGLLDGNAVHEECEEVASIINPSFLINTVTDEKGRAIKVYAGHWRDAFRKACDEYVANNSFPIEEKRELVIVSCGGFPYDINMIQAHKAFDMASNACADGGTIIFIAECADGYGRPDFLKWFDEEDSRGLVNRLRDGYEVNGQTAWSLMLKAERFKVHLVSSLEDEAVKKMRMIPSRSLEEALSKIDSKANGYIMPRGAKILPIWSAVA